MTRKQVRNSVDILRDYTILKLGGWEDRQGCRDLLYDLKALIRSEREYLAIMMRDRSSGKLEALIDRLNIDILSHEMMARALYAHSKR